MRQPRRAPMRSPRLVLDELASVAERFDGHHHNRLITYQDSIRWKRAVIVALDRYMLETTCCLYQVADVKISRYIRYLLAARCLQFFHPLSRVALGQFSGGNIHSLRGFLLPRSCAAKSSTAKIAIHIAQLDARYATWLPATAIHEYAVTLCTKNLDEYKKGIRNRTGLEDVGDEHSGDNDDADDDSTDRDDGSDHGIEEELFCWQVGPEGRATVLAIALHTAAMLASFVTVLHTRRPASPYVKSATEAAAAMRRTTAFFDQSGMTNGLDATTELPPMTYDLFYIHVWGPLVRAIDQQVHHCVVRKISRLKGNEVEPSSDGNGTNITEIPSTSGDTSHSVLGLNALLTPEDIHDSLLNNIMFLTFFTQTVVRILTMFITLPRDMPSAEVSDLKNSLYTFLERFLTRVNDTLRDHIQVSRINQTWLKGVISNSMKNVARNGSNNGNEDVAVPSRSAKSRYIKKLSRSMKATAKKAPRREHLIPRKSLSKIESDKSYPGEKMTGDHSDSENSKISKRVKRSILRSQCKRRHQDCNRECNEHTDRSRRTLQVTRVPVGRKTISKNFGSKHVRSDKKKAFPSDSDESHRPGCRENSVKTGCAKQLHSLDILGRTTWPAGNISGVHLVSSQASGALAHENQALITRYPAHIGRKKIPENRISNERQENNESESDSGFSFNSNQLVFNTATPVELKQDHRNSHSDTVDLAKREHILHKERLDVQLAALKVDIKALKLRMEHLEHERKLLEQ